MAVLFPIFASLLLASVCFAHPCHKLNKDDFIVSCEDANLPEFPNMEGFHATTFILNGNNFRRLTNTTFPPGLAREIQIKRNEFPIVIDSNAFSSVSSSLTVLKLQNVDIDFDKLFTPLSGLKALNSLEIGNRRDSCNLSVPFLDKETLNRLIRLEIVHSGVEDVQLEVLDSEFRRLRYLGFSFNKLQSIPEGIKHVMKLSKRNYLALDLSHNFLYSVSLDWFPSGCTLTSLNLAYNNIISVHLHALDNCPLLNQLDLQGNPDLLYINPSVFPSNCHLEPRMEIYVQHTGIRNVEFALRSCVGRVMYSNTSVSCTSRHISLTKCPSAGQLIGECRNLNGQYMFTSDAWQQWNEESCHRPEEDKLYNPQPIPEAGGSLASLKDWGDCQTDDCTITNTEPTIEVSHTVSRMTTKPPAITISSSIETTTITTPSSPNVSAHLSPLTDAKMSDPTITISTAEINPTTRVSTDTYTTPSVNDSVSDDSSSAINYTTSVEPSESIASTATYTTSRDPLDTTTLKLSDSSTVVSSSIPYNDATAVLSENEMIKPVTSTLYTGSSASASPTAESPSTKDEDPKFLGPNNTRDELETSLNMGAIFGPELEDLKEELNLTLKALELAEDGEPGRATSASGSSKPSTYSIVLVWVIALATSLLPQVVLSII